MTRLHIVDTGNPDGPPIVWLGSLGSSTAMWDPQIAAFADRHQCLLIDHPGHGSSPPPHRPLTIDSLGDAVLATLDDADIDHAHVVGLSLGAMIAVALATNHPARIDRLALLCTSAYFGPPDGWIDRAALVRAEGMASVANATVERWITPTYAAAHPDEVATLVAMLMSTDPEGYAACCEAIAPMDQRPTLPKIEAPTLVVAGTEDPATPPIHGETIASLIPNAKMATVEAAHLANWEQPESVNQLLRDHLEGGSDDE